MMQKAKLIEEKACNALQKRYKRVSASTILMYTEITCDK